MDVPTAIKEKLLAVAEALDCTPDPQREALIAKQLRERSSSYESGGSVKPQLPTTINGYPFEIRSHQREALNAWRIEGDFQGIFDLATGAGKTITAVYAIVQMSKNIQGLTTVIAVPYQDLADQWCDILEQFNIHPVRCYVSRLEWNDELERVIHDIQMGALDFAAIVVVNRTLKSPEFQAAIKRIPISQFFWIGDECHHHASEAYLGFLPHKRTVQDWIVCNPRTLPRR